MWGRRSIRFDLARLVHAEARRARRFGGLGPRVLRATACNPSFVSRDRHSLASPLREGGRDDSIASGSVCSVGHRIEPDFITRGFRVFGVFRGFTGLDFPGWACRLEFGAERAAPSGARGVDGVSGSTWPDWFTRRRGERGGLAGLVPASSAPPRETLLSFQGTATRWRLQLRDGGSDDSIPSGSVCSVGYRIEPDFIAWGFRVFGVFRGFTGLDFPGWLAAWSSELKERRPPVPVGSTEYPVRLGQTGSRGGAESAAVWRAWSPRPPRLRVKPLVRFTGPPLAGLAGRGGEGIGGPIPSGSVTSVCVPWATGFGRDRPTRRVIPDGAHSRLRHGGAVPGVIPAPSGRRGSRRWR